MRLVLAACAAVVFALPLFAEIDRVDGFIARLDTRVPELLLRDVVPSAAVAVIHDGRIVTRTWGLADVDAGRIATQRTRYNIASITKLLTAWGVMRLVEEGKVQLDDPIAKHVRRWQLPPSERNDAVTIRRLLSHSSGLSMPAVPWYGPDQPVPTIEAMLRTQPLTFVDEPGKKIHYSGGGFALLQLLIEEVSGLPYEDYMRQRILEPLHMTQSTFVADPATSAVPYDASVKPIPHFRFAVPAAAGLYTSIDDLALFAAATVGADHAPLTRESILLTQTPVKIEDKTPFLYGLGESLIALPSGRMTTGHSGSNEGWTCVLAGVPSTGDALVVLTNRSDAFPLYRELMCEWLTAAAGENWTNFCRQPRLTWNENDTTFIDGLFASTTRDTPGAAVLVAIGDDVVHRKGYGSADPKTQRPVTPETPFYVASLAKSLTSLAVLELVADGRMALADPVSRYVPGVPEWAGSATIEQLLSHTSGIPGYQQLIDWRTYDGIDNAGVIELLREKGERVFAPGARYSYSNSGYVLLAMAVERASGLPFRQFLTSRVFEPLGMRQTAVYDGSEPAPANRAIGYSNEDGRRVMSDYLDITLARGTVFPFRSTTVGSGGIFSTVDDLLRFSRAFGRPSRLPISLQLAAIAPRTTIEGNVELPDTKGHGFGWFLSRRGNVNMIWNQGAIAGHKAILVRVPQRELTVIVLGNAAETPVETIATSIVDRLLPQKR